MYPQTVSMTYTVARLQRKTKELTQAGPVVPMLYKYITLEIIIIFGIFQLTSRVQNYSQSNLSIHYLPATESQFPIPSAIVTTFTKRENQTFCFDVQILKQGWSFDALIFL